MAFKKTGEAPVAKVLCSCGGEIKNSRCEKCGREYPVEKKDDATKKN